MRDVTPIDGMSIRAVNVKSHDSIFGASLVSYCGRPKSIAVYHSLSQMKQEPLPDWALYRKSER